MPCFSNGSRLTRYRSEPVVVRRGGPDLLTFYTSRTWKTRGGDPWWTVAPFCSSLLHISDMLTLTTRDKEW
ncbi:hypothetical protein DY000_02008146 [Brassica cretica]|uniref:Uncharacterized protein n=1 Tax=Brassica cretica TaxID=69181 RepID=A0ABQ7BTN9_BRACR|nr:hypothetical protein DY000_02008146 [Brassica cretica]